MLALANHKYKFSMFPFIQWNFFHIHISMKMAIIMSGKVMQAGWRAGFIIQIGFMNGMELYVLVEYVYQ